MSTLVPGGASRVALKFKGPFNWDLDDKRGLMREGRRRLRVNIEWGMLWSQRCMGKLG